MRKIWDKIVSFLVKIPMDKWFHFIAGLIVAACACIVFNCPYSLVFAILAGALKEGFDYITTKVVEFKDFVATFCGGLVIQIFSLIALLFSLV